MNTDSMTLSRNWWLIILRGVLAILFGLAAFLWPGITWLSLILLFGVYALVDGVIAVVTGIARVKDSPRWWVFLLEGLLGIAAGLIAILRPGLTTVVFLAIISAWAIITGILEIAAAIRLRREIENEWWLALGGLLSIAFGVVVFLWPGAAGLAIVWTMGAYAILFGILLILLGFRLKSTDISMKQRPMAHGTR